jgi:hypothetical protein
MTRDLGIKSHRARGIATNKDKGNHSESKTLLAGRSAFDEGGRMALVLKYDKLSSESI